MCSFSGCLTRMVRRVAGPKVTSASPHRRNSASAAAFNRVFEAFRIGERDPADAGEHGSRITARLLAQAGVANTHMRLEKRGIHGNGHMLMIEKNNLEIAAMPKKWITVHVE